MLVIILWVVLLGRSEYVVVVVEMCCNLIDHVVLLLNGVSVGDSSNFNVVGCRWASWEMLLIGRKASGSNFDNGCFL